MRAFKASLKVLNGSVRVQGSTVQPLGRGTSVYRGSKDEGIMVVIMKWRARAGVEYPACDCSTARRGKYESQHLDEP